MTQQELTKQAFDALYKELQQYKDGFLHQVERPLLLDLILFYDSMNWFSQSVDRGDMDEAALADSFQFLMDELLELLFRRDVHPMQPSTEFDRTKHTAVRTVPSPAQTMNKRISRVLKRGFTQGERILRNEEVEIFSDQ
jgi:molecular chaperone GrpE (heat shock protein)